MVTAIAKLRQTRHSIERQNLLSIYNEIYIITLRLCLPYFIGIFKGACPFLILRILRIFLGFKNFLNFFFRNILRSDFSEGITKAWLNFISIEDKIYLNCHNQNYFYRKKVQTQVAVCVTSALANPIFYYFLTILLLICFFLYFFHKHKYRQKPFADKILQKKFIYDYNDFSAFKYLLIFLDGNQNSIY